MFSPPEAEDVAHVGIGPRDHVGASPDRASSGPGALGALSELTNRVLSAGNPALIRRREQRGEVRKLLDRARDRWNERDVHSEAVVDQRLDVLLHVLLGAGDDEVRMGRADAGEVGCLRAASVGMAVTRAAGSTQ
jgi:hypothetical protein